MYGKGCIIIMKIDEKNKDEKLQYNREAAKVSALPSDKSARYEYLTDE